MTGLYAPGQTLPVRVDPADPLALTLDQRALTTVSPNYNQQPDIPRQDPTERLQRLADLRDRGVIADSAFEAQKARILAAL